MKIIDLNKPLYPDRPDFDTQEDYVVSVRYYGTSKTENGRTYKLGAEEVKVLLAVFGDKFTGQQGSRQHTYMSLSVNIQHVTKYSHLFFRVSRKELVALEVMATNTTQGFISYIGGHWWKLPTYHNDYVRITRNTATSRELDIKHDTLKFLDKLTQGQADKYAVSFDESEVVATGIVFTLDAVSQRAVIVLDSVPDWLTAKVKVKLYEDKQP